jgi:hypothetical protein
MRRLLALAGVAVLAGVIIAVVSQSGSASAATANCTSSYTHRTFSSINVPPGAECALQSSTVNGTIRVSPNASLYVCGTTVTGSLDAEQAYVNVDHWSKIYGSVTLDQPGVEEVYGELNCGNTCDVRSSTASPACEESGPADYSSVLCPKSIGGSLDITNAPYWANEISVGECGGINPIGSVDIIGNRAQVDLGNSQINGSLRCLNNDPDPDVYNTRINGSVHGDCFNDIIVTTTAEAVPHR